MVTGQAERLMPMIESVMSDAGMSFAELDRIAIASGPGTFTGARIAVSAARALSLATGAAIVSITSLELMAMNPAASLRGAQTLAIATDARRGEVYFQQFDSHSLNPIAPPRAHSIPDAVAALREGSIVIAGSGGKAIASVAREQGRDVTAILPDLLPEAIDMLFIAAERPLAANVVPLYLRPPDAKPPAPSPFAGVVA
jgi:tRNA threonylcarbamoyladenosine biosynthesis protein TsaB